MSPDRPQVVVSGYASIDEVYTASRLAGRAETGVLSGPVRPASRHGGCGPNTGRLLAGLGVRTGVVSWVGDDPEGRALLDSLIDAGVDTTGVAVGRGATPRSLMIYDATGDAACYFHPSDSATQEIGADVRDLVGTADWLVITVGPANVNQALLAAQGPQTRLVWSVKADPLAFPPELCARLVSADLVCLNRGELQFLASSLDLPDATPEAVVERGARCVALTSGADGYAVVTRDVRTEGTVERATVADATGAGDAFLAGLMAGVVAGEDPVSAARRGAVVSRQYLLRSSAVPMEVAQ